MSAGNGLRHKWCHWCGAEATGTALDSLYDEAGRFISRLGGRYASCDKRHGISFVIPPAWCLCGVVDDRGDGTCGNCGLSIMADDDEARPIPPGSTAQESQ